MYIKQDHMFLSSIINELQLGFMAPAPMQRDYVWEKEDIEALCHSLVRGYPIGTFLLWQVSDDADMAMKLPRCGPIEVTRRPNSLIMDGHNRLASLAWMMQPMFNVEDPSAAESRSWMSGDRLVYDGPSERVRFLPPSTLEGRLWVGSECFFDRNPRQLRMRYNALVEEGHAEEEIGALFGQVAALQRQFNNARIVTTTLVDPTPEEARDAFMSIARAGVPLSDSDLDNVGTWFTKSRSPEP